MADLTDEQQRPGYILNTVTPPSKRIKTDHDANPCSSYDSVNRLSNDEEISAHNHNEHNSAGRRTNVLADVLECEIVDNDVLDVLTGQSRKPLLDPNEVIAHQQHELYDCPETRIPDSGDNVLLDKQLMKEDLQVMRDQLYSIEAELEVLMIIPSPIRQGATIVMPPPPSEALRQSEAERRIKLLNCRALLQLDIHSCEGWLQYIENVDSCGGDPLLLEAA